MMEVIIYITSIIYYLYLFVKRSGLLKFFYCEVATHLTMLKKAVCLRYAE
jgi:hypothetical protein